ncbi:MAG: Serine--tRNA ligase [Anaerolinea thermophila]|uniref:Serine--tRNA ligase n=1 Tax=Anaerolinea thermophila TaxID=167964 RepID=A0A117LGZ2_9CHLR|nr:MAG: Serine--tRNA ligase [Anaerolinea thermophila]
MIDIKLVREEPQTVKQGLLSRNLDPSVVDELLTIDEQRREKLQQVETLKAERNTVSREIGQIKDKAERETKIAAMKGVSDSISALDEEVRLIEEKQQELIMGIPNIPLPQVPVGKDESDNIVLRVEGEKPSFDFEPLPHWELGPRLDILDFDRGVKITGSRFYILSGLGARLQRALIAYMLDLHIKQGYLEKYTPFMVKGATLYAAGQLPKFADNLYKDHEEDLYLVPTAEVPLTGLHMNEFLDGQQLPLRYTAYTPCFRREKMSAGRDVRGIKRGHQFDKVEMYTYCKPENSMHELDKMIADAEETCKQLGLTYRILQLCTGDISFNACIGVDIEVWAPGCQEWLEVSSISNVGNFQARRANIKYKDENGRKDYVHTLNGSGLGMPRTLIAVLETYQQADGSIRIPSVLHPWMGGATEIR